jgi:NADH-quinone oxidoreductase subunit M
MNFREVLALVPIAVFVFWIGLAPGMFLKPIAPAVEQVTTTVGERFERQYATETASVARPVAPATQASIDKGGATKR